MIQGLQKGIEEAKNGFKFTSLYQRRNWKNGQNGSPKKQNLDQ